MKAPSEIAVVPSFWNRVPPAMPVILKNVTSAPSTELRVITSPDDDWVFSFVVAAVMTGGSATGVTVIVAVAAAPSPAPAALVAPCTLKLNALAGL